jgi:hypothetical protein
MLSQIIFGFGAHKSMQTKRKSDNVREVRGKVEFCDLASVFIVIISLCIDSRIRSQVS